MSVQKTETKKKKKKKDGWLEAEIMAILQKSLKTAIDQAMNDIFKGWK